MTYGIIMLCMLTDHYVVGACMSAYVHKMIIMKHELDIKLVVMCDKYIYDKYKKVLRKYYDVVYKIDMLRYDVIRTVNVSELNKKKYDGWIGYSINKWQCLKFVEYEKVLFIDVDIIPLSVKLYDVFNFDTPAIHLLQNATDTPNVCINNAKLHDVLNNYNTYSEYIQQSNHTHYTLNGGMVLFRPDLKMYDEYIKFVNKINTECDGIPQLGKSGIDETTLFYYIIKQHTPLYRICMEYMTIPWVDKALNNIPDKNKPIYASNYLQHVKPWRKPTFISYPEELLWRTIYKYMYKTKSFKKIYKQVLVDGVQEYINQPHKLKKRFYGTIYNITYSVTYDNIVADEKKIKHYGLLNTHVKNLLQYIIRPPPLK